MLHHQVVRLELSTAAIAPLDDDAHPVAEHLRRRALRSDTDLLCPVSHPEAQLEPISVPLHRSGNDLAAETDGHVVRRGAFGEKLLRRQEVDEVIADAAVDEVAESRDHHEETGNREGTTLPASSYAAGHLIPPSPAWRTRRHRSSTTTA